MIARRSRAAAALVAVATAVVPLLVLGTQPGAVAETAGSVTKSGTGPRFSDLKVTVSQVTHMRNQVIRVSWTGGHQSATSSRNFFSNYLQIMQCWGDEASPQREKCQYGGIFDDNRGGQATSTREIVNNGQLDDPIETYRATFPLSAVVPFQSVTGKTVTEKRNEFYDTQSTNEIDYGRTSADGTGEEFFEVQTGREASGLGCGIAKSDGTPRDCWLVVVPRDGQEVDGRDVSELPNNQLNTSPLSASNFANAISFRLDFDPVGVTCAIGSSERRLLGNEEAAEAVGRWQPQLCDATGAIFGYSQISDDSARMQTLGDDPWLSLVNRPLPAERNFDGRMLAYAPVSISAVGVGVVVERYPKDGDGSSDATKAKRGTRVLDLKLNARLVAKLLTQSYIGALTGNESKLAGNPTSLVDDPEFLEFNPEFNQLQYSGQLFSITNPLGLSDANRALWEWIKSDAEARAFINGEPAPGGMKVNPYYKDMDLDRDNFPRADPSCVTFTNAQAPLCALDHLAYAGDFHAAARGAIRGLTLANDTWDLGPPPRYKQNMAQPPGERAVLALIDTATAARFKIAMAQLKNASGSFVAPTQASMSAAVGGMTDGDVKGVLEFDPATKVNAAYPLTEVTYAMTAPRQLDKAEAKDYAGFVRYVAGKGQTPGISPGQLPEGYLPLPQKLRKQAAAVAALIAKQGGPKPATDPGDDEETSTDDGSGDTPIASAPIDSAAPAGSPAVGSPPPGSIVPASSPTDSVNVGPTRFVLLAVVLAAILAALARPGVIVAGIYVHLYRCLRAPNPRSSR